MAGSLFLPLPVITFSWPWVKRPGGRDTSRSWGRRDAQGEACGIVGKLQAAAGPGGGVSGVPPAGHGKPAVLVVLPLELLLFLRKCARSPGHISVCIMIANHFVIIFPAHSGVCPPLACTRKVQGLDRAHNVGKALGSPLGTTSPLVSPAVRFVVPPR